jgi:SAM-dependent methyltransferase
MLDIATGGGDIPLRLWRWARRAGVSLEIDACDRSEVAVAYARERAAAAAAAVRFFPCDAIRDPLPAGYDAVVCSLFLHHLDEAEAVTLLRRMAAAASRLLLVNDLLRCPQGYLLAHLATRLLSRCPVVHIDGPRSVQGAFVLDEVRSLVARAGLVRATLVGRWPCRFLLSWQRP